MLLLLSYHLACSLQIHPSFDIIFGEIAAAKVWPHRFCYLPLRRGGLSSGFGPGVDAPGPFYLPKRAFTSQSAKVHNERIKIFNLF